MLYQNDDSIMRQFQSKTLAPLTKLTSKTEPWDWGSKQKASFALCKRIIAKEVELSFSSFWSHRGAWDRMVHASILLDSLQRVWGNRWPQIAHIASIKGGGPPRWDIAGNSHLGSTYYSYLIISHLWYQRNKAYNDDTKKPTFALYVLVAT